MDVINQAYDDGLIMPGMIQYSEFENTLKLGKDKCLEKVKNNLERHSLDDIHAAMSWWACFNEKSKPFSSYTDLEIDFFPAAFGQLSTKSKKNKNKAKKKKRKQMKASKKNRR